MEAADDQLTDLLKQVDVLFEPSPELHVLLSSKSEAFLSETEPTSLGPRICDDTITFIGAALRSLAGRKELDEILNCHPRLGAKTVESIHSQNEQKNLASDPAESEKLKKLNEDYERTFPGLRYVVFVNGRPRSDIMANMTERIARNDINAEREEGITAMCDIARDRLSKTL